MALATVCSLTVETVNHNMCIICQKRKYPDTKLSVLSQNGKETLLNYASLSKEHYDEEFAATVIRIENSFINCEKELKYHRVCYTNFANPERLKRLTKKSTPNTTKPTSSRVTRAQINRLDLNTCIFCQIPRKEAIRQVTTESMNVTIRDLANHDHQLFTRISCIMCLIASNVKYHLSCLSQAQRDQKKIKTGINETDKSDLAMNQLCNELKILATQANVLRLSEVWERYVHIARLAAINIPQSFQSRMYTVGCHLLDDLGQTPLNPSTKTNVEKILVQLYKVNENVSSGDEARYQLFGVVRNPVALPPTTDALQLHILRCHYQVNVWENAHETRPMVLDPVSCGWRLEENRYVPILMTLEPVPKSCTEILTCNCIGQCLTTLCTCIRNGLTCTKLCHRSRKCLN